MDAIVRKMVSGDLKQVLHLSDQLGYPNSKSDIQARFDSISQDLNNALFVAEVSSQVVGWIYLGVLQPLTSEKRVQIWGLVVDKESRKLGIGKQLVSHGEDWARSMNVKNIEVGTNQKRIESHVFYKKNGIPKEKGVDDL